MKPRRFVAPLAVTAAVAAGGIGGALIGMPAISSAQTDETTPDTTAQDATPTPDADGAPGRPGPGALDAAAEALGMERADLLTELKAGKTIAAVAGEKSVDVNAVIDAMVADVLEKRPDADEAEVRERVTTLVNEGGPIGRGGPGGHGGGPGGRMGRGGPGLDAAAEALGIETDELVTALKDGKTIADIAGEKGVDVNAVIDSMVAEARTRIEDFVNNGPKAPPTAEGDEVPGAEGSSTAS